MRRFLVLLALAAVAAFFVPAAGAHHGRPVHLTTGHDTFIVNTSSDLHVWAYGGDDHVNTDTGKDWLEGMYGSSWYEHASKVPDGKDALFMAARTTVAYRFGGTTDEAVYIEPYALASVLDPDTQVTTDQLWEGVVGVNVGYWRRARLSLQGEINKGQRNFPAGYFMGPPLNRTAVILQAGVAF